MAFSLVGSTTTGNNKVSGTTYQPSYGITSIAAGLLCILTIAKDNTSTSATDADYSEIVSITDTAGNTYIKAKEFTNTQAAAAGGATSSIWYCVLANAVTSANFITITFSAATTAKAHSLAVFSFGVGNTISVKGSTQRADDAADTGALSLSGFASKEYLYIRTTAYENTLLAPTISAGWTSIGGNATSGGATATNIGVITEYLISVSTGATSDPTITACDNASVMVALEEIVGAAPATSKQLGLLGVG